MGEKLNKSGAFGTFGHLTSLALLYLNQFQRVSYLTYYEQSGIQAD